MKRRKAVRGAARTVRKRRRPGRVLPKKPIKRSGAVKRPRRRRTVLRGATYTKAYNEAFDRAYNEGFGAGFAQGLADGQSAG